MFCQYFLMFWSSFQGHNLAKYVTINVRKKHSQFFQNKHKGWTFLPPLPPPHPTHPTIVFHIDPVGCVMSVGRTWRHQKTPREKALKHISEVLEYFQLWKKHKLYIFWVRGSSGTYNQVSFIWKWQKFFFQTILPKELLLTHHHCLTVSVHPW